MATYTYPHAQIRVQDNSAGSEVTDTTVPLHLPVFFTQASMGRVGVPFYGAMTAQKREFGSSTFDNTSAYYTHQTFFAETAMSSQGVFNIRLTDGTETTASLVLLATVTSVSMPQYKRDALGAIVLDATGNPVPETEADGTTPVTEPGLSITYTTRPLAAGESLKTVKTSTVQVSDTVTATVYPIFAAVGVSAGSGINDFGFRLFSGSDVDTSVENNAGVMSCLYRFQPVQLVDPTSGQVSVISDIYSSTYNDVSFKSVAKNTSLGQRVDLASIVKNNYSDSSGTLFPYNVYVYSNNVEAIGNAILAVSPELLGVVTDPFLINLFTADDADGNPYEHFEVDASTSGILNSAVTLYLQGGTDGAVNLAALEAAIQTFSANPNVSFLDYYRYPFSHVYDSGFQLNTKYGLLDLLSARDDINIDLTTFDATAAEVNTQAQDQSMGATLLARARTYPESEIDGTAVMRVSLFQQCGPVSSEYDYGDNVPTTFERLLQRVEYYSGDHITGSPKERPDSELKAITELSWSEATATQRQLNWDTCLNTAMYADMNTLFFPDLRTAYTDETSTLSDAEFVDWLIFLKHIVRNQWTYFSGGNKGTSEFPKIMRQISAKLQYVYGSRMPRTVTIEKTAADIQRGYSTTVIVSVQGDPGDRLWDVFIPVSRLSTDSTASVSSSTTN